MVIPHTAFINAEKRLGQLYTFASNRAEAEGLALIGEAGTGKTSSLNNLASRHPRFETPNGTDIPILITEVPPKPTVKGLAYRMLDDLGVDDPHRGTEEEKRRRIKKLLHEVGTKIVMLDEFQHFVDQGTHRVMHHVADWLKSLINETKVTLVIAGLPSCMAVIDQNPQLARRFSAPILMPRFDWIDFKDRQQFRSILRGFYSGLSEVYDCPDFSTENMAFLFYLATGGLMGYLVRLLRQVELDCITDRRRKISLEHFHAAYIQAIWAAQRNPDLPKPFAPDFELSEANEKLGLVRSIGIVSDVQAEGSNRHRSSPRRARSVSELLVGR